jgi:linoleate 9S-lipoxygenase
LELNSYWGFIFSPDPKAESRIPVYLVKKALEIYVPRDERFGHLKLSDFLGYSLKAITEAILPIIRTYVDTTPKEFDSFQDIYNLYDGLLQVPDSPALADIKKKIPFQFIKSILPVAGDDFLNLPLPQVIKSGNKLCVSVHDSNTVIPCFTFYILITYFLYIPDKFAWRTDEEFTREMLAGVNPVCIKRVTVSAYVISN